MNVNDKVLIHPIGLRLSEEDNQFILKIQKDNNLKSKSEAVRFCINQVKDQL
jgi:hypothetical protein